MRGLSLRLHFRLDAIFMTTLNFFLIFLSFFSVDLRSFADPFRDPLLPFHLADIPDIT